MGDKNIWILTTNKRRKNWRLYNVRTRRSLPVSRYAKIGVSRTFEKKFFEHTPSLSNSLINSFLTPLKLDFDTLSKQNNLLR